MTNGWIWDSFKRHERDAHTLIWSIMSCFCAYKREQSGHLKTDTFWFSMCWSKWRYNRVCRVNTVSHMEHLYIILKQRSAWTRQSAPTAQTKGTFISSQDFRRQRQWEHINTVRTKQFSVEINFWRQLTSLKCRSILIFLGKDLGTFAEKSKWMTIYDLQIYNGQVFIRSHLAVSKHWVKSPLMLSFLRSDKECGSMVVL